MNTSFSSISLTKITTILDEAKQTLDAIDIKIQDTIIIHPVILKEI